MRGYSSSANTTGPFARRDLERHDLVLEAAGLLRGLGLVLARHRELVLLLARHAVLLGDVLGGDAHVVLVEDVPQAVDDHGVDHLRVAHAKAVARAVQHVRRGLMFSWPPATTMSESPLAIACAPSIAAFRPEPQTLLMVIAGTMSGRPARIDRLARRVLADARGEHLAHDDFGDLLGRDAGALEQHLADDVRAEVGRGDLGERAAELADRGARRAYDERHVFSW